MSNHNAETLTLTQINQKGTIIEPRRTLVFPIPENVQDWTQIRFGIAVSLTDLLSAEAQLPNISSDQTSNDSTEASNFFFGLTTNQTQLPGRFGSEDRALVMGQPLGNPGTTMKANGGISIGGSNTRQFSHIKGNTQIDTSGSFSTAFGAFYINFSPGGNHSQFYDQNLTVLMFDININNKGNATQNLSILAPEFIDDSSGSAPPGHITYANFTENEFINTTSSMATDPGGIAWNENSEALPLPQNIIFHWPFFDKWRLRLHGAVLIKKA